MNNAPVTVTTTVARKQSLLPPCIGELWNAANELALATTATARTIRKVAEGMEKTVEGIDEVTTLMLRQQRERLLKELTPA